MTDKRWVACPNRRCEQGAVFVPGDRFYTCPDCSGKGVVERAPGFFGAMRWTDLLYPALCVLVMVLAWWWLV